MNLNEQGKVIVSQEMKEALDKQGKDDWTKQFNLIAHCKSYSGNGVKIQSTFTEEFWILNDLSPLEYAKCLILGYDIEK